MWFALSVMIACNWDVSQENQGDPTAESQPAVLVDDAQVGTKLNLVWVVIDTLRADHVSLSGHRCGASNPAEKERKTTPNLDRLASQGAYALRAYSQSGWTLTSMASLLTGLYPHQHRVGRDPSDAAKFGRLQDDVTTFAEMLQGAGYATGAVVNNTFMAPEFRMNQGFDFYDYQGATNDKHRSAQDTVVAGLSWMNKQKDPAFLVVHFMEPHLEYRPPADILGTFSPTEIPAQLVEVAGKPSPSAALQMGLMEPTEETIDYLKARYDEEIVAADRALAQLVEGLGGLDDTLLVVTSDHGEEFWDHGGFEHGHALYGELTRVPLVVVGPGVPVGPIDAVVEHVDLIPALLNRLGLSASQALPGMDFFQGTDGVALSENCLYGPPCLSLVGQEHRFVLNQDSGRGQVWTVGANGCEAERVEGDAQRSIARRLVAVTEGLRGSLGPVEAVAGPQVPSNEVFRQLSALGYVDGPDGADDLSGQTTTNPAGDAGQ